jgi:hypothetical protein
VLRHGLLGDVEVPGDLVHGTWLVTNEAQHGLASRLGQRPEDSGAAHLAASVPSRRPYFKP